MDIFEIPEGLQQIALKKAECGMGYQEVTLTFGDFADQEGLLIAGIYFFPCDLRQLASAEVNADKRRVYLDISPPEIHSFKSYTLTERDTIKVHPQTIQPVAGLPQMPPFKTKTQA